MCLACEEQDYFFRLWCTDFLARGEMPPGVSAEDLEVMGLPLPASASRAVEQAANEPAPKEPARKSQRQAPGANAFACDSPDE